MMSPQAGHEYACGFFPNCDNSQKQATAGGSPMPNKCDSRSEVIEERAPDTKIKQRNNESHGGSLQK